MFQFYDWSDKTLTNGNKLQRITQDINLIFSFISNFKFYFNLNFQFTLLFFHLNMTTHARKFPGQEKENIPTKTSTLKMITKAHQQII